MPVLLFRYCTATAVNPFVLKEKKVLAAASPRINIILRGFSLNFKGFGCRV